MMGQFNGKTAKNPSRKRGRQRFRVEMMIRFIVIFCMYGSAGAIEPGLLNDKALSG